MANICVSPVFREDKAALAKLVEAIKTNYNDRYEEVSLSHSCAVTFYTECVARAIVYIRN